MAEKRTLITGAAGFIGKRLAQHLVKYPEKFGGVYGVDRKQIPHDTVITKHHYYTHSLRSVYDPHNVYSPLREHWDYIFHLAADARVQPSFTDPEKTIHNNISALIPVLDNARRQTGRIIYAGSSLCNSNAPESPYGISKKCGEILCLSYALNYDADVTLTRLYNVYGPGQPDALDGTGTVIGIWERQLREGKRLTVVGDGKQARNFTHVDDVCEGLINTALRGRPARIYHLGNDRPIPLISAARALAKGIVGDDGTDTSSVIEFIPKRRNEPRYVNIHPGRPVDGITDKESTQGINRVWQAKINLFDYLKQRRAEILADRPAALTNIGII